MRGHCTVHFLHYPSAVPAPADQVLHFMVIDLTFNWFPRWTWPIRFNCSRRQLAGSRAPWRGTHPDLAWVMWEWFNGRVEGWSGHWPASVWTVSEMRVHIDAWEVGQGLECLIVKPGMFFTIKCLKTIFVSHTRVFPNTNDFCVRHNLTSSACKPKGVIQKFIEKRWLIRMTHWSEWVNSSSQGRNSIEARIWF